jgi:hypothetical protein
VIEEVITNDRQRKSSGDSPGESRGASLDPFAVRGTACGSRAIPTPATSGYPYTGGVTASTFYAFDYQGITAMNNDVGLVILDEPYQLDTYGSLAAPGTLEQYGTGPDARVTVSGYGVTYVNGNPAATVSYRSRLMVDRWIIGTGGVANGINVQLSSAPGRWWRRHLLR